MIKKQLSEKQETLVVPERSFAFGLEMINHVFDSVIKEIEKEKAKIVDEFKVKIEQHCNKKFEDRANKLSKELDKCSTYLTTTSQALDETYRNSNFVEICHEFVTVNYLNKAVKKFESSIDKAEKYAVF